MPIRISTVQQGLEESIIRAQKRLNARGGLHININDRQMSRPLGKITGSVSEFNKSLEASNARVLAFGASVGIIQGVQTAFKALVSSAIEVEKQLAEINVVMGLTNKQLEKFGEDLFSVAKNTAQSFATVSSAATELARQGLTMEETLKRTNDALILTRLTGLDAASAVSGLTAALNTFNKAGLDSTQILSKMAAVDVQFAVSTEDLIDAVSRAGAVANDAGVSFDQLMGAVTAAQQMTARGGKVIGNSFKTIFTRVQRSSTISRLEELGIAVRDMMGNTLPAITVLENLAKTYDGLADTTKAAVAEQVGGVFQINILKAAIKDLSSENSILARATELSANATDEAYKKNELLNRSLSALASQTGTSIKELSALIGEIGFSDNIRTFLTFVKDQVNGLSGLLTEKDGEENGYNWAKGVVSGVGKVLTGPGMIAGLTIMAGLAMKTFSFLGGSVKELLGITSQAQKQKQIQQSIVAVLGENSALQSRILSTEGNRAAQEKIILSVLQAQSREQAKIAAIAKTVSPALARSGYGPNLKKSAGHIPNYVSPADKEIERKGAFKGGYAPGAVKDMNMPGVGKIIYNTAEKIKKFPGMQQTAIIPPENSQAGEVYRKEFNQVHGFDPYANRGLVPNYGLNIRASSIQSVGNLKSSQSISNTKAKSSNAKINLNDFDEIISPSKAQEILTSDKFKSIKYTTLGGDGEASRTVVWHGARGGVKKHLKGAPPPKGYASWAEHRKAKGLVSMFASSVGGYRTPKLSGIHSIVADGKKYLINHDKKDNNMIPNFALSNTPKSYLEFMTQKELASPKSGINPNNPGLYDGWSNPFKPSSAEGMDWAAKSSKYAKDFDASFYKSIDALKFLDNQGLEKVKSEIFSKYGLRSLDFGYTKVVGTPGENLGAKIDVDSELDKRLSRDLSNTPARDIFNYLTGQTSRISGSMPNHFIRLVTSEEHAFRKSLLRDLIANNPNITEAIYSQVQAIKGTKKSGGPKTRALDAFREATLTDTPKLGYDPNRGISQASLSAFRLRNELGMTSRLAQLHKTSGSFSGSGAGDLAGLDAKLKSRQQQYVQKGIERDFLNEMYSLNKSANARSVDNSFLSSRPGLLAAHNDKEYEEYIKRIKTQNITAHESLRQTNFKGTNRFFRGIKLGSDGHVPNFMFRTFKTAAKAVGTFKSDTAKFGLRDNNFWDRGSNKIKVTARNHEDVRQFVNSKGFRSLDENMQKELLVDLKNQSKKLGVPDVTRPYFKFHNPSYEGRIFANEGVIPNFSLFSNSAEQILQKNPQYVDAVRDAVSRESSFGLTPKVVSAPSLKSSTNPGLAVVNQEQEGGSLSNARKLHSGLNPNQKTSVPNYASISGADMTSIYKQAGTTIIPGLGMNAMEMSAQKMMSSLPNNVDPLDTIVKQLNKDYIEHSQIIKKANLQDKINLGLLGQETHQRQQFAKQMLREQSLSRFARQGGQMGALASSFTQYKGAEMMTQMYAQKEIADQKGDRETSRGIGNLIKQLEKDVNQRSNAPLMLARAFETSLRKQAGVEKMSSIFTDPKGEKRFNKQGARQFYAREFLGDKAEGKTNKQIAQIVGNFGKRTEKQFSKFLREQGVVSSNQQLARGGLMSGEFKQLVAGKNTTFLPALKQFEKAILNKDDRLARQIRSQLSADAVRSGTSVASVAKLQQTIDNVEKEAKDKRNVSKADARQEAARKTAAQGGRFNTIKGMFQMGMAGGRDITSTGYGKGANLAGRAVSGFTGGTKNYLTKVGGMGGNAGIAASIVLPMLSGLMQNQKSRSERATFEDGRYRITEGRGMDIGSSVAMGAGLGAMFGLPGLIVGAAGGFIAAMRKSTLSIQEQIEMREREIAVISQNAQALSSVQNLSSSRAEAFALGKSDDVNRLDAQINQALSGISDSKILEKATNAVGNKDALSSLQKEISDKLSLQTNVQNFGMALRSGNSKNAGVALGGIMAQQMQNGEASVDVMRSTLDEIRNDYGRAKKDPDFLKAKDLAKLKNQTQFGREAGIGTYVGGITSALVAAIGVALAPTGVGTGLGTGLILGSGTIGATIGQFTDNMMAKDKLESLRERGLDQTMFMGDLATSGLIPPELLQPLMALLDKGKIEFDEILKNAEESALNMKKIRDNSNQFGKTLFDLNEKYRKAINEMVVELEVSKIKSASDSAFRKTVVNESSRYMSNEKANGFQAREMSKVFAQEVTTRLSNFSKESDISFLREMQQNQKSLSLMPSQTQAIVDMVKNQGMSSAQSMIDKRALKGTYQLEFDRKSLTEVFNRAGFNDLSQAKGSTGKINIDDVSDFTAYLGTDIKEEQEKILENLRNNLDSVLESGQMSVDFERNLGSTEAKLMQRIIDSQENRRLILEAQIEADRRNLETSNAIGKINSQLMVQMEEIGQSFQTFSGQERNKILKNQMNSQGTVAGLEFQKSDMFRGFRTDDEELKRQTDIRRKIADEELKMIKMEVESRMRSEAARLLSDQNLINALDNLGSKIEATLTEAFGSPSSKGDSSTSSSVQSGKKSAEQKNIKTGRDQNKTEREKLANDIQNLIRRSNDLNPQIQEKESSINRAEKDLQKLRRVMELLEDNSIKVNGVKTDNKDSNLKRTNTLNYLKSNNLHHLMPGDIDPNSKVDPKLQKEQNFLKVGEAKDLYNYYSGRFHNLDRSKDDNKAALTKLNKEKGITEKRIRASRYLQDLQTPQAPTESEVLLSEQSKIRELTEDQLSEINLARHEFYMNQLKEATSVADMYSLAKQAIEEATQNEGPQVLAEKLKQLGEIMQEGYTEIERAQQAINIKDAQDSMNSFVSGLKFLGGAQNQISQYAKLSVMDQSSIRGQAGISSFDRILQQKQAEKQYEILSQDPTATKYEVAQAKQLMNTQQFGTQAQNTELDSLLRQSAQQMQVLQEAQQLRAISSVVDQKTKQMKNPEMVQEADKTIANSEATLERLNQSIIDLTTTMERTTPRDKGVVSEIKENLGGGLQTGFAQLDLQSETIYTRLGEQLPIAFKDGLADAMQAALSGAGDLDDKLRSIGISFLQMIQRAFLESAASRVTSAIGGAFGLKMNSGGEVRGGSGVKDDVPAMLTGGEYVIKKSSVEKYGTGFLDSLNKGAVAGYNQGGMVGNPLMPIAKFNEGGGVNLNIGAPRAAERESYVDRDKNGNVTRYKIKKGKIGINRQLTGYAMANDKSIQKFFQDEERQFGEDLQTKKQEEQRQKMKDYNKKMFKRNLLGMALGIVGGALISKGADWASNKFKKTEFAQNRFKSKAQSQLSEKGYINVKGRRLGDAFSNPTDGLNFESKLRDVYKNQGPVAASRYAYNNNVAVDVSRKALRIKRNQGGHVPSSRRIRRNTGGGVPALLTGGEYVMQPSAVQKYGTGLMSQINKGTAPATTNQSSQPTNQNNVTHGDVNITINVAEGGQTSQGNPLNSKEFASKVKGAVMEVISKEKRVGGSLRR